jgi:predicted nucleotidyltransferase
MLNVSIKVDLIYQFDFNCKTMVNEMPKKTREEILKLLSQNKYQLENRFKVRRMALFGSYARADQKSESDVDILVDIDPSVGLEFVTLAEQIEQLLGLPVELVSRRAIKPNKLKYIEQDLIYV